MKAYFSNRAVSLVIDEVEEQAEVPRGAGSGPAAGDCVAGFGVDMIVECRVSETWAPIRSRQILADGLMAAIYPSIERGAEEASTAATKNGSRRFPEEAQDTTASI